MYDHFHRKRIYSLGLCDTSKTFFFALLVIYVNTGYIISLQMYYCSQRVQVTRPGAAARRQSAITPL